MNLFLMLTTMIDELIGNTNVYLGEFDDLCDDFDIDE